MREMHDHRRPVEEGLVGTLFYPSTSGPHPAVLALGGAGGGFSEGGARSLASEGFAALALAYFGVTPLPRDLVEIPLEYFGRAMAWLRSQPAVDADRLAVVGNSKGGELALLLGATYPEHVKAVVGYAPSGVVWQGIPFDRAPYYGGPRSPWSYRSVPLPFAGFLGSGGPEMVSMAASYLEGLPVSTRFLFEQALEYGGSVGAASIAVENIDGPIMLVSGTEDRLWPATRLSGMVIERLRASDHPFPYEHLRYEGAGHMISPAGYVPRASWIERFELGGNREANEFANADSWPKVVRFLKQGLEHGAVPPTAGDRPGP